MHTLKCLTVVPNLSEAPRGRRDLVMKEEKKIFQHSNDAEIHSGFVLYSNNAQRGREEEVDVQ